MSEILAVSKNEKPYDVFICYKETDEKGERTIDSVLAYDIYEALTAKGMNVFFARVTLEDKLGRQYEPYIFAALNSAKVMLPSVQNMSIFTQYGLRMNGHASSSSSLRTSQRCLFLAIKILMLMICLTSLKAYKLRI